MLYAQLCQSLALKRAIRNLAIVAAQPCLTDFFREFVIGINRRQIERAPRTRVKCWQHQEWIKTSHREIVPTKKTARKRNGLCRTHGRHSDAKIRIKALQKI